MDLTKVLGEFLGTTFLIYVIIATGSPIAAGAALALAMYSLKDMSGGQVNPAVTLASTLAKKTPTSIAGPYILAQIAGAFTAFEIYKRFPMRK